MAARRAGAATTALIIAATIVMVALLDTQAAGSAAAYGTRLHERGSNVLHVAVATGATSVLSADDCAALAQSLEVDGWMWAATGLTMQMVGGYSMDTTLVGGNVWPLIAMDGQAMRSQGEGITLVVDSSAPLAGGIHGVRDLPIGGAGASARLLATPLGHLGAALSPTMLVLSAAPPAVDSCLFATDDRHRSALLDEARARLPLISGYSARWVLASADSYEDPATRWQGRWSRHLWLIGGLGISFGFLLWIRIRRAEFALYRLMSGDGRAVALGAFIECASLLLIGVAVSALFLWIELAVHHSPEAARRLAAVAFSRTVLLATFTVPVAVGLAVPHDLRATHRALRETL